VILDHAIGDLFGELAGGHLVVCVFHNEDILKFFGEFVKDILTIF